MSVDELELDLAAFRDGLCELELRHMNKWVLFHGGKLVSAFSRLIDVADDAVIRFGDGPFLIRTVGRPPLPWFYVPADAIMTL